MEKKEKISDYLRKIEENHIVTDLKNGRLEIKDDLIDVNPIEVRKDELYILCQMQKKRETLRFERRGITIFRTQLVPADAKEMWWERRRFIRYSKFLPQYQAGVLKFLDDLLPEVLFQFEVPREHMYRFINEGYLPLRLMEKRLQPCAGEEEFSAWCAQIGTQIKEHCPNGFFFKIEDVSPKDFPGMGVPDFKACIAHSIEGIMYRIKNSMRVQRSVDLNLFTGMPIIVTLMKTQDCFKDRNEVRCLIEKIRDDKTGRTDWGITAIIQNSIMWPPSFGPKFLKRAEKFLKQHVLTNMNKFEIIFPEGIAIDLVDLETPTEKFPLAVRAVELNPLCDELLNVCYALEWKYVGYRKFVYNRKCNHHPEMRQIFPNREIVIHEKFIPLFERKKKLIKQINQKLLFLPWTRRLIEADINKKMTPYLWKVLSKALQSLAQKRQKLDLELMPEDENEALLQGLLMLAEEEKKRFSAEYIANLQYFYKETGSAAFDVPAVIAEYKQLE